MGRKGCGYPYCLRGGIAQGVPYTATITDLVKLVGSSEGVGSGTGSTQPRDRIN
jgi:hypothetical protein